MGKRTEAKKLATDYADSTDYLTAEAAELILTKKFPCALCGEYLKL